MSDNLTSFHSAIHDALKGAGFRPQVAGCGKSGLWRVWRAGYGLSIIIGRTAVSWNFTTEYINVNRRDLGPEYRKREDDMLDVLRRSGFHAYRSGSSIEVCCQDQMHDHHAECRGLANA